MSMSSDANSGQDFDLNLAPIIDCMTVLIAFMLASTAFLSIGILDAGVAAAGAQSTDHVTPPPIQITLEMAPEQTLVLKVTGQTSFTRNLPRAGQGWDYARLVRELGELKKTYPELSAVVLSADNPSHYQDVVNTMETLRPLAPAVLLGGF